MPPREKVETQNLASLQGGFQTRPHPNFEIRISDLPGERMRHKSKDDGTRQVSG